MKSILYPSIKVTSSILITGAIALELWRLSSPEILLPPFLDLLSWLTRFALIAHAIEGIIAAGYAPSRQKPPLRYGLYTFFVGTVGLAELFQGDNDINRHNA